ncbi:MAG: hypothetical protein COA97_10330 [Flavobacteriales bacterium]|nr:MAG: hypothetical protein COA97_10330 [Flavobacteriales bacterium]
MQIIRHIKKLSKLISLHLIILIIHYPVVVFNCYSINDSSEVQVSELMQQTEQLGFQENKGQIIGENDLPASYVLFKAEAPNLNIWITTTGLTYQFFTIDKKLLTNDDGTPMIEVDGRQKKKKSIRWHRVDMILKEASIKKENISSQGDITKGNISYYLAHCPDGIFDVKTYKKITLENVYPGIDWIIYTSTEGIKHDFIVHPGADPKQIKLIYEGSGNIEMGKNQIQFSNKLGEITEGKLLCYQNNNIIKASYKGNKNNKPTYLGAGNIISDSMTQTLTAAHTYFSYEVSIELNNYDKTQDLIIDPQLAWGTLFGGSSGVTGFTSMDTDGNDNLFITGYTTSSNFPTQNIGGFFQSSFAGGALWGDVVVLKFDNNGILLWATYYGGTELEQANSIATDKFGNIWITGYTKSTNFPTQNSGTFFQGIYGGASSQFNAFSGDVFLLKFDNTGNRLWATYYGGTLDEIGNSITTDLNGNVWVTGWAQSNFPTQDAGTFFQGTNTGSNDVFLLKFDNVGNRLLATYYGGTGSEQGNSITTDLNGNVWVSGGTGSTNFPTQTTGTFFQGTNAGSTDIFLLKFDNLGNRLWATYYGGILGDISHSIKTDPNGNVWVSGGTGSANFPTQNSGTFFQGVIAGSDIFLLKFDNLGNRLWATYYGGSSGEASVSSNLVIDNCSNAYLAFETRSNDIFTLNPGSCHYYDGTFGGGLPNTDDAYVAHFDNVGNLLWGSYIGGEGNDFRTPLAIDSKNNLFMGGEFTNYTTSVNLPMQNAGGSSYFNNTPNGFDDSYILKFIPPTGIITQSQVNATTCEPCNGSATVNVITCGLPPYSYLWSNGSQTIDTTAATNTITGLCEGNYNVAVVSGCNQTQVVNFNITGLPCIISPPLVSFIIPNVFSPNGDNQNDLFEVSSNAISSLHMKIFNRWGTLLFETNQLREGWNGRTTAGIESSEGTYFYVIEVGLNGTNEIFKGFFTLLR